MILPVLSTCGDTSTATCPGRRYTDGLVVRRDRIIDVGITTVTDVVYAEHPATACDTAMSLVAGEQPGDSIAVLALHRTPPATAEA
jgi:hypothetical protein